MQKPRLARASDFVCASVTYGEKDVATELEPITFSLSTIAPPLPTSSSSVLCRTRSGKVNPLEFFLTFYLNKLASCQFVYPIHNKMWKFVSHFPGFSFSRTLT